VPEHTDARIQQLCKDALEAKTPEQLEHVIPELRLALEEHIRLAKESLKVQRSSIAARDARSQAKDAPPQTKNDSL
jgi:hypothetical protein